MHSALEQLLHYASTDPTPREIPIGLAIPRTHHIRSQGDASFLDGGTYCKRLSSRLDISVLFRTSLNGLETRRETTLLEAKQER